MISVCGCLNQSLGSTVCVLRLRWDLVDLKWSYFRAQRSTIMQTDGLFLETLLNIATNTTDQRGSEVTFHLWCEVNEKSRLTWLLVSDCLTWGIHPDLKMKPSNSEYMIWHVSTLVTQQIWYWMSPHPPLRACIVCYSNCGCGAAWIIITPACFM